MPLVPEPRTPRLCLAALSAALMWASFAFAQQAAEATAGKVAADANVIEVSYQCAQPGQQSCSILVSRREFDALVNALDPNMTATHRQSLATEYSRLLIMAAAARRRHIDESPELQTLMKFSELQLLATRLVRDINSKPATVSAEQVEQYYRDHRSDFREVTLSRILFPVTAKSTGQHTQPALEQAWRVHNRATQGEDFGALQREITGNPGVRTAPVQCRFLPEGQRKICALEPGKISEPLPDGLGYSIFRVENRRDLKLDEVRDELRWMLERRRLDEEIQSVRNPISLRLNENYFGKLPAPDLAAKHGLHTPSTNQSPSAPVPSPHQHE